MRREEQGFQEERKKGHWFPLVGPSVPLHDIGPYNSTCCRKVCLKKELKGDKVEVFSGATSTDVYEWRFCRNKGGHRACRNKGGPFRACRRLSSTCDSGPFRTCGVQHMPCGRGPVEARRPRLPVSRGVIGAAVLGVRAGARVQRVRGGHVQRVVRGALPVVPPRRGLPSAQGSTLTRAG